MRADSAATLEPASAAFAMSSTVELILSNAIDSGDEIDVIALEGTLQFDMPGGFTPLASAPPPKACCRPK